jgi:hypothetical protein
MAAGSHGTRCHRATGIEAGVKGGGGRIPGDISCCHYLSVSAFPAEVLRGTNAHVLRGPRGPAVVREPCGAELGLMNVGQWLGVALKGGVWNGDAQVDLGDAAVRTGVCHGTCGVAAAEDPAATPGRTSPRLSFRSCTRTE